MGELVSGVASALSDKLATKAYQEIALACGLKGDVERLRNSMRIINAFLMDAENKQAKNDSIAEWLKQLRDTLDDAVDILDEIEYEAKRNEVVKMYGSTSTKVRRFLSCSNNPLAFRIKMAHNIRDVKQRIDETISVGRKLGIAEQHVDASTPTNDLSWRETASFVPPRVCGRIKEKEELISLLMRPQTPSQSLSQVNIIDVIPIVGIGGLGKTTLAQMVYNDTMVKEHFDMLMWVCVSDDDHDFDVKSLIHKIIQAASKTDTPVDQNSSLEDLLSLFDQKLHGKRFLLVLDDVWNEKPTKWNDLINHLVRASGDMKSNGSKIIVTTGSNIVAAIIGSDLPIRLKPLPEKECWELFVKCAFREEKEAEQYPRLKEIGEDIVRKCKGVPLAITTLGCLLSSKSHDEDEWKKVRDSEIWEVDPEDDGILPSLRLCYNNLPPKVKQCFSYCSHFPKHYEYRSYQLIMFWKAHGLLQPTGETEEPEHIGELCIKKLVSASLLQIDGRESDGFFPFMAAMGLYGLKMHDRIHDFAKSTMKESKKTRTITRRSPEGSSVEWTSNEFKYLKVLDLEGTEFHLLPDDCFAKVKHLRYLSLFGCDKLEKLPGSICKLLILQSLDLSNCRELQELPKTMKNLVSLQSLLVTVKATSFSSMDIGCLKQLQFLFIIGCTNLVSLPSALGSLIALKRLLISKCTELANFEDEEEEGKQHVAVHDLNLQAFVIGGSPKLKALPNWLKRSTKTLRDMFIKGTALEALPEWLPNVTSLEQLFIEDCPELSSLPNNMDQLRSLNYLHIKYCPNLVERCEEAEGPDWPKIAHIPRREIH